MEEIKKEDLDLTVVQNQVQNSEQPKIEKTNFSNRMEDVKLNVLSKAATEDQTFVNKIKTNLKNAAVTNTEIEQSKANFEKQQVTAQSEVLSKFQQKNANEMKEDKWANREKKRQFAFNGVKPIMNFVGIQEPMNIFLCVILTVILIVPFLVGKLWNGTCGKIFTTIIGDKTGKAMKAFLWIILVVVILLIIFILLSLFLKTQGVNIFIK